MIKSCYVHIPFCKKICSYCDFCKNFYDENIVNNYILALKKEIKDNYKGEVLNTLYIGGGTPSCLSLNNLSNLFSVLKPIKLSNDYEFTFECNFEDITKELLLFLKNNKVNRLSIGIQSFNKKHQKILERCINKDKMISCITLSKKYFKNINVDLMYALPGQTLKDLKSDLEIIKKIDVNHISIYALILENHTKLKVSNLKEIADERQYEMYELIKKSLTNLGFNHYEISNFSKLGYASKHNLTYWNNLEYYGFGAGASGFIRNIRYDNTKSIINYISGKTCVTNETIDKNTLIKDEVMLRLRKIKGINKRKFKNKFKIPFNKVFNYQKLVLDKLLMEDEKSIFIPEDKLFVSNEIIIRLFDEWILE